MNDVKQVLDEQFNQMRLNEGVEPLVGNIEGQSNSRAKDIFVALDRSGDINSQANLAHFGISQAFAWEYLRKKQKVTENDLQYAKELQAEMEKQLEREREVLGPKEFENDHDLAMKLQQELNTPSPLVVDSNLGLTDSAFARILQEEEQSKVAKLLEDSEFARRIANEVLVIDPREQELRHSKLSSIVEEEVITIRNSQTHSLPEIFESENILRESGQLRPLPIAEDYDTFQVYTPVYATKPIDNYEKLNTQIYLSDEESIRNKYSIGCNVQIRNFDYPEMKRTLQVAGYAANPNCCILAQSIISQLFLETKGSIIVEKLENQTLEAKEIVFETSTYIFLDNPSIVTSFTSQLVNDKSIIQQGSTIPFKYASNNFEVTVKSCIPDNSIIVQKTNIVFSAAAAIPIPEPITNLSLGESIVAICPTDGYVYYKLEIPEDKTFLEDDLLIETDIMAGNMCVFMDQKNQRPSLYDHTWSIRGKYIIKILLFFINIIFNLII